MPLNKYTIFGVLILMVLGYIGYLKLSLNYAHKETKKIERKIQTQDIKHFEEIQEIKIKEPVNDKVNIDTSIGKHKLTF